MKERLGLDIGGSSIKLVHMKVGADGKPVLVKHLIQELPLEAAAEGGPARRHRLAEWLRPALKEFPPLPVHVGLSGPEVVVRRLDVPSMSASELREAVRWQIKDELPFGVQDAVVDCAVVGDVWDKDIKKRDVLVAASSRAAVQGIVEAVEQAGGRVAGITPALIAAWRGASALTGPGAGAVALVEIGDSATHVAIVKDGHVRVTRELPVGGRTMTEALVGVVASEHGERTIDGTLAETLKRRYGVLPDAASGHSEEGVPLFHVASLMRPVLEQALTEISRFLDFYRISLDSSGVSRVMVCGGGAAAKGLPAFLAEGLGLPVSVWNPLTRVPSVRPLEADQISEDGPRLAVAAGLAIGGNGLLNLLPAGLGVPTGVAWPAVAARVAAGLVVVALGFTATGLGFGWHAARERGEWERVQPRYEAMLQAASRQHGMERALAGVDGFAAAQPVWDGVFKELARLTPTGIELDGLSIDGGPAVAAPRRVVVRGRVVGATEGSVAHLVDALERSAFFRDPELAHSELRSEPGKTRFDIEALLE